MAVQSNAPVIIKRKKVVAGDGHHGGAWKVAMSASPFHGGALCAVSSMAIPAGEIVVLTGVRSGLTIHFGCEATLGRVG
jgi:hypothetical protein